MTNSASATRPVRPGRFCARAVPALALVAGVFAASAGTSAGAEPTPVLPDLAARAAARPGVETYADAAGTRRLLRFDGYVYNRGTAPLEIRASGPVGTEMSEVVQRVFDPDGGHQDRAASPRPRVLFEPEDGHHHWHLRHAARYSLWNSARAAEVAPAQKVGFCLMDSTRTDTWAPATPTYTNSGTGFCGHGKPDLPLLVMGISAGWRDYYDRSLPFQWVDVSDVQPGPYGIRSDVDPDGVVLESVEQNTPVYTDYVLPGYVAEPISQTVSSVLPSSVTLRSTRFGSPGSVQYRIETPPAHGKLNVPSRVWLNSATVSYTPESGYTGSDTFTFSARENGSPFPRTPRPAAASLKVGGLLGLPLGLSATQQSAEPSEPAAAVPVRRAPGVPGPLPGHDGAAVSAVQVHRDAGDLVVRVVAWRAGELTVAIPGSAHRCRAEVPAGGVFSCLLVSGLRAGELRGASIQATLRAAGEVVGSRAGRLP